MPMTERSRHKLYETFTALIDDETAVQEMLSYFPARDVEEPVTKDFLRAEFQTEIVSTVRQFVDKEVIPTAQELEHSDTYPQAIVDQIAAE